MKRQFFRFMLPGVVCLLSALQLFAASVGTVTGTVKDATGAVVPGVKLTLTSTTTNTAAAGITNRDGDFTFIQVVPTTYSLLAEAQGFKKISVPAVLVQVDQITRVDLTLEVGAVGDTITVEDVSPLLENDKSTLSSVVDSTNISNLPLNGRQALDIALVTPGTLPSATGTQGGGFNVSGARSQSNMYLWDGVSNMDTQINSNLNNFRVAEAIQEFSVQTSVASAEFGRGTGGQVSMVTKSGTNALHGSLFEYVRNDAFDATDFFINKAKGTKTPLHRNQFGGTAGGPIKRDKLFIFGSFEEFRQVAPTPSLTRVPTQAERDAVTDPISKALLRYWPLANTSVGSNNFIVNAGSTTFDYTGLVKVDYHIGDRDVLTGRFANYQGEVFTPGALPNTGGNSNSPISRNGVLNETHTFSPTMLNEFRMGYSRNQTRIVVQDADINAATIFTKNGVPLAGVVDGTKNTQDAGLPTIGISGGFAALGSTTNLPQGRITNTLEIYDNFSWVQPFGSTRHSVRAGYHQRREQARRYLDGNERGGFNFLTWADFAAGQANTSNFKTGSTLVYWDRIPFDLYVQDQYKPKSNLTINYGIRYEYPTAIHQARKAAVNFIPGVGPVLLGTNQLVTIDPAKLGLASIVLKTGPVTLDDTGVIKDKNNFAPVIGIAYTPRMAKKLFGEDATVIRAGFRVGFDDIFNNIPANLGLNAPYNVQTSQTAGVTQPGKFGYDIGFNQNVPLVKFDAAGKPLVGLVGFNAEDPNIRSAYLYQYNVGIQRRLGHDFSLELDYQGSAGHKLGLFVDQNQPTVTVVDPKVRGNQFPNVQTYPYPTFGSVGTGNSLGNSIYNGGVLIFKYQSRKGYFIQSSYTVGKSIDTNSAYFGSAGESSSPANPRQINLERGPSSFDTRQRFVTVYNMDLPMGPGHRLMGSNNMINRGVFGGWTMSGITSIQTGQPFTVNNSAADFSGFNQGADRPDLLGAGPVSTNFSNPDNAFDVTRFGCSRSATGALIGCPNPPTGRVGTSGRNQYYGPHLANYDFTMQKSFRLWGERSKLTFRSDFFNVFNHTNFSNPVRNLSSANFGRITQTVGSAVATAVGTTAGAVGGARQIQFVVRLTF